MNYIIAPKALTTGRKLSLMMLTKKLGKQPMIATEIINVAVDKRSSHEASVNSR